MENVLFSIANGFAAVGDGFKAQAKINRKFNIYLSGLVICAYLIHSRIKILEKKVRELERLNAIDKED